MSNFYSKTAGSVNVYSDFTTTTDNRVNHPFKYTNTQDVSCNPKNVSCTSEEEKVNHPSHYTWLKDLCGIEVIDITRWLPADISNAVKYLLRQGHKHEEGMSNNQKAIEDCKKAIWYINDYINNVLKK